LDIEILSNYRGFLESSIGKTEFPDSLGTWF